jgi:hypothetical protein
MNNLNTYRHWYLYCKGWYLKTDIIEDLKVIQSHWSGIAVEHLTDNDVLQVMLDVVWPHIVNKYHFTEFMSNQLEDNIFILMNKDKAYGQIERILLSARAIIMRADEESISGKLGEPDYSILPKSPHVED